MKIIIEKEHPSAPHTNVYGTVPDLTPGWWDAVTSDYHVSVPPHQWWTSVDVASNTCRIHSSESRYLSAVQFDHHQYTDGAWFGLWEGLHRVIPRCHVCVKS